MMINGFQWWFQSTWWSMDEPWFPSCHQRLGVPKALPQSRHPVSCTAKGSSHGVGFQISLRFCVLRNVGFYGGRSANPATNLLIRNNSTAGGRPQTQLGTRYGWPLAHKELLRPLTGFVFKSRWVSIYKHPPHQKTWWGRRFCHRQPDHGTG